MIFAQENGRVIGAPDKLFGVSSLAKERINEIGKEKVINTTIGVLMDDNGKMVVLDSVMEAMKDLKPADYAAYAPILGLTEYLEAVKEAVFMGKIPEGVYVEGCYTPGGTGAIKNAISGYTKPGDKILTSDWHWAPYDVVAKEQGRGVETYQLFDHEDKFNKEDFERTLDRILATQEETLIIVNTPAHNPTGYTFTLQDWDNLIGVIKKYSNKKIALLVDIAYLDFSGDPWEYRRFLQKLTGLPETILPLIAFSASKGYTMYGMRCGAIMCMAPNKDIAREFKDVMTVESRASWSNGNRSAMTVIAKIFQDQSLKKLVFDERGAYLEVLKKRGEAFMEEASKIGLKPCPYDSGFFITIPCDNAEEVGKKLQEMNVFAISLGPGVRVSVASNTIEECRSLPYFIAKAVNL